MKCSGHFRGDQRSEHLKTLVSIGEEREHEKISKVCHPYHFQQNLEDSQKAGTMCEIFLKEELREGRSNVRS